MTLKETETQPLRIRKVRAMAKILTVDDALNSLHVCIGGAPQSCDASATRCQNLVVVAT